MTSTEWIVSIDDDLKDFDEMFVGNVRDGDELIRCKDCAYYRLEIDMCDEPHSTAHNIVHEDDYCSRAERREKNDKTD